MDKIKRFFFKAKTRVCNGIKNAFSTKEAACRTIGNIVDHAIILVAAICTYVLMAVLSFCIASGLGNNIDSSQEEATT